MMNQKIISNKAKHLLVANELKKLQNIWLKVSYKQKSFWRSWCSKFFGISTNAKILEKIAGVGSGNYIYVWKSKGLFDKRINYITTSK